MRLSFQISEKKIEGAYKPKSLITKHKMNSAQTTGASEILRMLEFTESNIKPSHFIRVDSA